TKWNGGITSPDGLWDRTRGYPGKHPDRAESCWHYRLYGSRKDRISARCRALCPHLCAGGAFFTNAYRAAALFGPPRACAVCSSPTACAQSSANAPGHLARYGNRDSPRTAKESPGTLRICGAVPRRDPGSLNLLATRAKTTPHGL